MSERADIIVIGAALNGLAAALALGGRAMRRPLRVTVVDARDPRASLTLDGRASAITASARRLFEALGVWRAMSPHAQAMREIIVTDAPAGAAARPALLHFGDKEMPGEPSAHMVENRHLNRALLDEVLASPAIRLALGQPVTAFKFAAGLAEITLADGTAHKASLIAAADGRNSPARHAAGIAMTGWDYGQSAIVATVTHDLPHNGCAEEHFTPSGPFAILPLPGNRSSLVWTEPTAEAARIMALPEAEFLGELRRRFGPHRGEVNIEGDRHSYPLGLWIAKEMTASRLALLGDAAHVVHPIAGLGFNLGLRDIAALAESVHDAAGLGLDPGGEPVLDRYSKWRRFDTISTAATMDALNRLFANDNETLRTLRGAGLMAVDRLAALKSIFMTEAAGQTGTLPKLMRGEPI